MTTIEIELHVIRQSFLTLDTFLNEPRHWESDTIKIASERQQSLKDFLQKYAQETLHSSGPVSCLPQLIDIKNLLIIELKSDAWNESAYSFVQRYEEQCSHDDTLVVMLNIFTVGPSPQNTLQVFRAEICVKLHLFNPNDNKREVVVRHYLLKDQQLQWTVVEAADNHVKYTAGKSKEEFDKFANPVFQLFTIKHDGASPVLPEESKLNMTQFIQSRKTDLPDPNKLIVLVHAFSFRKKIESPTNQ